MDDVFLNRHLIENYAPLGAPDKKKNLPIIIL